MAKKVLLDAVFVLDSNDLTSFTAKVELEDNFEDKETTTYGSGGAKEFIGGIESGSISVSFKNDYAAGQLDEIMWSLRRQVVSWYAQAEAGAVTASNPRYSGELLVNKWTPIAGSVGDVAEVDAQFPLSGPMARATST